MNLNATLFAQMVVFLILAWFTMKFVWPPLINALDERAKKIADGLSAAEKGKAELEAAHKRVDQELAQARNDGQQRIADAEKRAVAVADEIKAQRTSRSCAHHRASEGRRGPASREGTRSTARRSRCTGCEGRRADPEARSRPDGSRRPAESTENRALIMAELATIARPYAEALFRVAEAGDHRRLVHVRRGAGTGCASARSAVDRHEPEGEPRTSQRSAARPR